MLLKYGIPLDCPSTLPPRSRIYDDPQPQSLLISHLPAELRNRIYTFVFSGPHSVSSSTLSPRARKQSPHPLSLLLTCRLISHEATILAFGTYSFPLTYNFGSEIFPPTYLNLRAAVSHLSTAQVDAISCISTNLRNSSAGSLLVNALLVFPHLSHFSIKSERTAPGNGVGENHTSIHSHPSLTPAAVAQEDVHVRAVEKYAPYFFRQVVSAVTAGRDFAWQTGERWAAIWPQLDSALCYSLVQHDTDGHVREELRMDDDAISNTPGVKACGCGCGRVSWTSAVLMQEGGRSVHVDFVYRGDGKRTDDYVPRVVLVPGSSACGEVGVGERGGGFDPPEEYWEARRRRKNRDLSAVWRGVVRGAGWPFAVVGETATDENK